MIENAEIRERWRAAAPGWGKHAALLREMTAPVSSALVEWGAPAGEERWLDVAAGIGDPALHLARALGPGGLVVVSDFVVEMVQRARAAVRDAGSPPRVAAVAAAAEGMPFARAFDGLTCRFGAMFFADPPRALAGLRATLVPGGRAIFAVWAARERNAFFREVNDAVRAVVPDAPEPGPDDPHGFRYAADGALAGLLRAAGWEDVEERRLPFTMAGGLTPHRLWETLTGISVELADLEKELPPERALTLRDDVEARAALFLEGERLLFPAEARLVRACAPAVG
ncbi:MAG TPA: class I SAM-dependent methyltransferase [Gemmatimonadota bacterium]|nr:class I SAM-dependent methyltransferase [Gemmatimonadota bacterium]